MSNRDGNLVISSDSLQLSASPLPLDEKICGFPVASITSINVKDKILAPLAFVAVKKWIDRNSYEIVSCRLPHNKLTESFLLEDNGFRFIEMVLHPKIDNLKLYETTSSHFVVDEAVINDVDEIASIAQRCFKYERFHIDPRLNPSFGDLRYAFWVRNSINHPNQKLLKISLDNNIVGFFVVEERSGSLIYWHLTAINPKLTRQGIGYDVWMAIINYHKKNGFLSIKTTISARNPVINLYSKLNFRFDEPDMTFHWVSQKLKNLNLMDKNG